MMPRCHHVICHSARFGHPSPFTTQGCRLWTATGTAHDPSLATAQWNREGEGRPCPHLALHPDLPAVELYELPAEGQPQPRALCLPLCSAHLPELLEHRLLVLGRDADSGVGDRD